MLDTSGKMPEEVATLVHMEISLICLYDIQKLSYDLVKESKKLEVIFYNV